MRIINLVWLAQRKMFVQIFWEKQFFQQTLFMRILSKIQPADYLVFLHQLSWLVLLILSMLFQIIYIGKIICIATRHILICEYNNYNIFLGSHIPLSIWNKTTNHSLENKIIINTLVFIRGHIVFLVFSALICLVIVTLLSVLFII